MSYPTTVRWPIVRRRPLLRCTLAAGLLVLGSTGCAPIERERQGEACVITKVVGRNLEGEIETPFDQAACAGFVDPVVRFELLDPAALEVEQALHESGFALGPPPTCIWTPARGSSVAVDKGTYRVVLDTFDPAGAGQWTTSCLIEVEKECPLDAEAGDLHEVVLYYGLEGCCFDGEPRGGLSGGDPAASGCPPASLGVFPPG